MWEFWTEHWQWIVTSLGVASGIGAFANHFWQRIIRRMEQSDLENRASQLGTVKDLVDIRENIKDKKGPESILVQIILKTTVTNEILRLSGQINAGNKTVKYFALQSFYVVSGLIFMVLASALSAASADLTRMVIWLAFGLVFAISCMLAFLSNREQRLASLKFISTAISSTNKTEDINRIIDLALSGEQFVENRGFFHGVILGEKQAKESFNRYLPDDSPLLSPEALAERKRLALEREASAQTEPPTTAQKNQKHPFSPLLKRIRCLSTKKQ